MNRKPGSSAVYLAIGTLAVIAGVTMAPIGAVMNATEVVSQYAQPTHPGMTLLGPGIGLLILGALTLATGLYNLAAGVDYLVANAPVNATEETASTEAG
ncbi:hypothetical protein [Arthrobacter sp. NyZ413]|uniref:hypothetical protein n=1 Tax=Arthrobacter sp. NyZ413 TaxID=3144669 RepID=UPI003BF81E1A